MHEVVESGTQGERGVPSPLSQRMVPALERRREGDAVAGMAPMSRDRFSDEVSPHWSIDFWVDDADAIAARAAELGGKVIAPPFDTPISRTAVQADLWGAEFSVTKVPGT